MKKVYVTFIELVVIWCGVRWKKNREDVWKWFVWW